jgi:transposase-like protein
MTRCSVCDSPRAAAIEAALRSGASLAAIALAFGPSRATLRRHRDHTDASASPAQGSRDHLREALELGTLATTPREKLRAAAGIRQAVDLELRDWRRARTAHKVATPEQLAQLQANLASAWGIYASVRERPGPAVDALVGVRQAEAALRAAEIRLRHGEGMRLTLACADGSNRVEGGWIGASTMYEHYEVPERYRNADHDVVIQLSFSGSATVTITDTSGEVVWERPGGRFGRLVPDLVGARNSLSKWNGMGD